MFKTSISGVISTLLVAGSFSIASAAWTQTTTTQDETTEGTAGATPELSMSDDAVEVGRTYTRAVNGDWELQCLRTENEESEDPCQMFQLLTNAEGAPVAEVQVYKLPEGSRAAAAATIVVPLETSLQDGLNIEIDGTKKLRFPFQFCNTIGCYARFGLTEEELATFQRGAAASVTILPAFSRNQPVVLTMSLKGFTASFKDASVLAQ